MHPFNYSCFKRRKTGFLFRKILLYIFFLRLVLNDIQANTVNHSIGDMRPIVPLLESAAAEYPSELVDEQRRDVRRIAYNIRLSLHGIGQNPNSLAIVDIGGGIGLFSLGCAALGFRRVILVDDFMDSINLKVGDKILDIHRRYGVEVVSRDVIRNGLGDGLRSLDIATSFDSIEHWHHSPKKLFGEIMTHLNPGGRFVLGGPNCANLRKRIEGLLGRYKWTSMQEWYESENFRGHVREPDVDDFRYIARDMGLTNIRICGRNWLGHYSSRRAIRIATSIFDRSLRLMPSLCSNIYLVGEKPKAGGKLSADGDR